jgi:hypothetical protein
MNEPTRGLIVGACFGALAGFGYYIWLIEKLWLFPGDPIAAGALLFAVVGFIYGDQLGEAIKDFGPEFPAEDLVEDAINKK